MEIEYSLMYISYDLHTFVRYTRGADLSELTADTKKRRSVVITGQKTLTSQDSIVDFNDDAFINPILSQTSLFTRARLMPLIFSLNNQFAYAIITLNTSSVIIGPVRFSAPTWFRHVLSFKDLGVTVEPEKYTYWLRSVPVCDLDAFATDILLPVNLERDGSDAEPYILRKDVIDENCVDKERVTDAQKELSRMIFDRVEDGVVHNPYNHELRERHCVMTGDVDGLHRVLEEDFTGRYGKLGSDPVRQERNIGIVAVTIASRAAIQGGLHFETAFSISDITIQQMEKCNDVETIKHIYHNAEYQYASLVRDLKADEAKLTAKSRKTEESGNQKASEAVGKGPELPGNSAPALDVSHFQAQVPENAPRFTEDLRREEEQKKKLAKEQKKAGDHEIPENRHISRCKDYIFTHLHGKITVQEIAEAIGLEPNYLSALFRKEEHTTLKAYIMHEKVSLIKNLLVYSQYPYAKIAAYLGFASQSHMSKCFRIETGMTPGQYRNAYQREDFIRESLDE